MIYLLHCRLLTQTTISNEEDAIKACDILHDMGVEIVVITSLYYHDGDSIILIGSSRNPDNTCRFKIHMPKLPHYYTGTGDLCSSLILAWSLKHPSNLTLACEKAVAAVRAVILKTAEYQNTTSNPIYKQHPELRLIQSRDQLEHPTITLKATPINS